RTYEVDGDPDRDSAHQEDREQRRREIAPGNALDAPWNAQRAAVLAIALPCHEHSPSSVATISGASCTAAGPSRGQSVEPSIARLWRERSLDVQPACGGVDRGAKTYALAARSTRRLGAAKSEAS